MTIPLERVSPAKVFARSTDDSVWLGPKQERALAHLLGAGKLKVLIGPPSSGKSMIVRQLEKQAKNAVVLSISGPKRSTVSVLSALLSSAEIGLWTLSEIEQRNLLAVFAQHRGMQGKRLVICIDRIADFSDEAWREIETLSLLQFEGRSVVELVITATESDSGRAPLDSLLQRSATNPFDVVHLLSPPDGRDLESYIGWRLARFGIQDTFTADACDAIATITDGRYSSINLICQVLMWNRASGEARLIDADAVRLAKSKLAALKNLRALADTQKLKCLSLDATPAAANTQGRLVVTSEGKPGRQVSLKGWAVIGRSKDCDLRLNSRLVSSHHAFVIPTADGGYVLVDLDSTNGLLVNGKFVPSGLLGDGDVIDIGDFRIRVELNSAVTGVQEPEPWSQTDDGDTDLMPAPDLHPARARMTGKP